MRYWLRVVSLVLVVAVLSNGIMPQPVHAAISLVNSANVLSSTANQSTYTSSTYTPASNSNVLVVLIHGYQNTGSDPLVISSITWGGADISGNIQGSPTDEGTAWQAIYVLTNPGTTAKAVSYTTANGERAAAIDILEFSGVDTAAPVTTYVSATGSGTSGSLSYNLRSVGAVMVGGVSVQGDPHTPFAATGGATEATEGGTGGATGFNDIGFSSFYEIGSAIGADTNGTGWVTSNSWAMHGVELKASGSTLVDTLLDYITTPTFAFSISRYLKASMVGEPVARFRESATGNQLDFKLNGSNELVSDDVNEYTVSQWMALTSATTTFVVSVYDQSGNNRTFTQSTLADQPHLVQSSALNGKAAVDFGITASTKLVSSSITITPANGIEVHALVHPDSISTTDSVVFSGFASSLAFVGGGTDAWVFTADSGEDLYASEGATNNVTNQMAWRYLGGTNGTFVINENGTQILSTINPGSGIDWRTGIHGIGNQAASQNNDPWDGLIGELIFYNGIFTANDIDDIELSQQTQGGLIAAPAANNAVYRAYNLGTMLLNAGTLIFR